MYYIAIELEHEPCQAGHGKFLHPYDRLFFNFEEMKEHVERHSRMCPACETIEIYEYDDSGTINGTKHWKVQNCMRAKAGVLVEVNYD